jgi:secreted PhoX family phosphatase
MQRFTGLSMRPLPFAPVLLALAISLAYAEPATRSVASVEFTPTAAPLSDAERSSITTQSQLVVHYTDGSQRHYPLAYHRLFATTDRFDGRAAGQIADRNNQALKDAAGQLLISDAPDANSLLQPLPGARAGKGKNALHLVTHYEYATSDSLGKEGFWARLPAGMTLTRLDQDKRDGSLSVREVKPISFKDVDGLWVPCAGSLSPWNTHLGSEEYEPDARCVSQPDYRYPSSGKAACTTAPNTLEAMQLYGVSQPNPYDYGLTPEVSVKADGRTSVVKHRALGRQSREKVQVMPDNRTAFQGDDGTYNMLTMFIADKPRDLSSGTLYAAKWQQAGDQDGGTATLAWIRLGHGSDREIEKLAHQYRFDDIFETAPVVVIKTDGKISGYEAPPAGFKQIIAGHNSVNVENLRLKPGMEQAAAFLETRRYAAYQGATTEFDKYEGVALNAREHKVYHAITQIAGGMVDNPADPRNDVRLPANICGAVYEMSTGDGQKDSDGQPIASDWVGTAMRAAVVGKPQGSDAIGNTCDIDGVSRPDNLSYSEKMRVLFIGEDTNRHLNNFLWAYHLDSGKLVRILSLPAGAESTGLQVVDDRNGFAYIMSNYQHAAEFSYPFESWNVSKAAPELAERLSRLIDRRQGAIGYIGGLPRLK